MSGRKDNILKKKEFIACLAEKGYTKTAAETVVNDVFTTMTELMIGGESIQIHGFGTFSVRDSALKEIIDKQTRERISIPGHKSPRFTPGKLLKRAVKEGILRTT